MEVGVLSLQGDFSAHSEAVRRLGETPVLVKKPAHLKGISGLIMPGGESTAHIRLLEQSGLNTAIAHFHRQGFPIFGTCAGLILISQKIVPEQFCFGFLPVQVLRNAYGSQKDSFITDLAVPALGEALFTAVFIRAPKIGEVTAGVETLANWEGSPVLVRHGNTMGATFHPELTRDLRVHQLFVEMCKDKGGYQPPV